MFLLCPYGLFKSRHTCTYGICGTHSLPGSIKKPGQRLRSVQRYYCRLNIVWCVWHPVHALSPARCMHDRQPIHRCQSTYVLPQAYCNFLANTLYPCFWHAGLGARVVETPYNKFRRSHSSQFTCICTAPQPLMAGLRPVQKSITHKSACAYQRLAKASLAQAPAHSSRTSLV